jgi:hypothetical protein
VSNQSKLVSRSLPNGFDQVGQIKWAATGYQTIVDHYRFIDQLTSHVFWVDQHQQPVGGILDVNDARTDQYLWAMTDAGF